MKRVAAKDAKNRFGQLIDDAQRQPVTVEKNGRPFVVVQSFEDFQIAQQLKMASLRTAINEARAQSMPKAGKCHLMKLRSRESQLLGVEY